MNQTQEHSCIVFRTLALTSFPSMAVLHLFLIPPRLITDQVTGPLAGCSDYHILSTTVSWTNAMLSVMSTPSSEYFNMSYYSSQDYNSILLPHFQASSILGQYSLACLYFCFGVAYLLLWNHSLFSFSPSSPLRIITCFLTMSTLPWELEGHHNLGVFYSTDPYIWAFTPYEIIEEIGF